MDSEVVKKLYRSPGYDMLGIEMWYQSMLDEYGNV